jgi:hypothetical protein
MAFQKGNKFSKGGKRTGAGRKSKETKAYESKQAALAWRQFDKHRPGIIKEYIRLAEGGTCLPFGGTAIAIIKDAVGKWIPPAKQELDVKAGGEKFVTIVNTFDASAQRRAEQEAKEKGDA